MTATARARAIPSRPRRRAWAAAARRSTRLGLQLDVQAAGRLGDLAGDRLRAGLGLGAERLRLVRGELLAAGLRVAQALRERCQLRQVALGLRRLVGVDAGDPRLHAGVDRLEAAEDVGDVLQA